MQYFRVCCMACVYVCVYVYKAIEMDTKMLTVLLCTVWLEVIFILVCVI